MGKSSRFVLFSFLISLACLITGLIYWQALSWKIIQWQTALHREMAVLMRAALSADLTTQLLLLGLTFLYGVFHAAGPGHGKAILSTYLATHNSRLKRAMQISVGAAMMQGFVAITLVTVITSLLGWTQRQAQQFGQSLDKYSFWLVSLLGLYLSFRALHRLYRLWRHRPVLAAIKIKSIATKNQKATRLTPYYATHASTVISCSCGHIHAPTSQQINQAGDIKTQLVMMLSMGIRPCTGALLILVLAKSLSLYWLGIGAVLFMSAGTAITVCLLAWFSHHMRHLTLEILNQRSHHSTWLSYVTELVAFGGGILLILLGIGMAHMMAVQVSPFFRPG